MVLVLKVSNITTKCTLTMFLIQIPCDDRRMRGDNNGHEQPWMSKQMVWGGGAQMSPSASKRACTNEHKMEGMVGTHIWQSQQQWHQHQRPWQQQQEWEQWQVQCWEQMRGPTRVGVAGAGGATVATPTSLHYIYISIVFFRNIFNIIPRPSHQIW